MAIKFIKTEPAGHDDIENMGNKVRMALGLSADVNVTVGVTRVMLDIGDAAVILPGGIAKAIKEDYDIPKTALMNVRSILGIPGVVTPVTIPNDPGHNLEFHNLELPSVEELPKPAPASYDAMTDEEWVEHVAGKLFPGTIPLYQANEMYQPVLGTSGGSIYKTCFVGPTLKVAARIKGPKVSMRVTTNENEAPSGELLKVFERLGITNNYSDRLTVHVQMSGEFNDETAAEYRACFGAFYAALKPWITSNFPAIGKLAQGVK